MTATSILVLGAGELGMSVLRGLARHPARYTDSLLHVLLRPSSINSADPVKQRDLAALRSLGIGVVPGDLAHVSPEQLSTLFGGYGTVIGCTGFVGGSGTQRKLADAVLQAGVPRYLPWQFGVDYDVIGRGSAQNLFDEQLDVRDLLRSQQDTQWIIVSTGMFTSFLFEPVFGVVDLAENTVRALGSWDTAVTATTAEDIGALTAEIVFAKPRIRNQVVYTAGDTLTYAQLAATVESVVGRPLQRVEWSVPWLRDQLAQDPENALKKYRVVFGEGRGVSWPMAQTFNAQHGLPTTDVKQWVQANLQTSSASTARIQAEQPSIRPGGSSSDI